MDNLNPSIKKRSDTGWWLVTNANLHVYEKFNKLSNHRLILSL